MFDVFKNTYNAVRAISTDRAEGPVARFQQAKEIAKNHIDNNDNRGLHNLGGIFQTMVGGAELDSYHADHRARIETELQNGNDPFKGQNIPKDITSDEGKTDYLASKKALGDARMTTANRLFTNFYAAQNLLQVFGSGWGFFSDKENSGHHLTNVLMNTFQMFLFPAMSNSKNPTTAIMGNFMAVLGMQFLHPILEHMFDGMNQPSPQMPMRGGGLRGYA